MAKLVWDAVGARHYETGVSKGVLFPMTGTGGTYVTGVPWNGLVTVTESPSGAEASPLYADNIKYLSLTSVEEFGCTIEAYTYPDEFGACDGTAELDTGIYLGQQGRALFGLAYVTQIGNDVDGNTHGEKLHLVYGCLAAPSERAFGTINDSPEAITFSWEVTTTPVAVSGKKPTSLLIVDSTKIAALDYTTITDKIYGTDGTPGTTSTFVTPDEIVALLAG